MQKDPECSKAALSRMVRTAFPEHPYVGVVMKEQREASVYESAADNLDVFLKDRSWTSLEREYLQNNPDDYILMTDSAVTAFLGAWLCQAIEQLGHHLNVTLDAFAFHIATGGNEIWSSTLRLLNREQRTCIYLLMRCNVQITPRTGSDDYALQALRNIEQNI